MENQIIAEYTNQGLSRLRKDNLVHIISELRSMPTELGLKISENIPFFFDECDKVLSSTDSLYKEAIERNDHFAQQEIDMWEREAESCKNDAAKAETPEEKEKCEQKANEARNRIAAIRTKTLDERNAMIKSRCAFYGFVLCIMVGTLGVTIKADKIPFLRR